MRLFVESVFEKWVARATHPPRSGRSQDSITEARPRAFTRLELLAVLAALTLLALVCVPLLANTALQSNQTACLNNLRRIGIAFQAWGADHGDERPWFVPTHRGGSRQHPLWNNAFLHFAYLSNHLSPRLLFDPGETVQWKRMANNWGNSPNGGFFNLVFQNNALSYMMGAHAYVSAPNEILVADRNVHFERVSTSCSVGFSQVHALSAGPSFRGWTNGPHAVSGNVLFNDGRVEPTSNERLKAALTRAGVDGQDEAHFLTAH